MVPSAAHSACLHRIVQCKFRGNVNEHWFMRPQRLAMQIKNHDEFPKFDHRSAPSFWAERDGVSASPRARPGEGRHDQLGNFQSILLGRITPASTAWPRLWQDKDASGPRSLVGQPRPGGPRGRRRRGPGGPSGWGAAVDYSPSDISLLSYTRLSAQSGRVSGTDRAANIGHSNPTSGG